MTDPADIAAADDDADETALWLSLPGLRESLAEADADYRAGRTFGEQEIRARYGLPP
jgi:PHD/YefM family antitoxin component YafN of YafNO toxin-antitoxin module